MSKLDDARDILNVLRVPAQQQSDMCCYVLLAMSGIRESTQWSSVSNEWLRIHDVIAYIRDNYGITYAENSRETIRKQAMHHFRNAAFIEDNGAATNSPNYRYRLTNEMLLLLRCYNSRKWRKALNRFLTDHESLITMYSSKRSLSVIPITINAQELHFSGGAHNQLQKAVIEEFVPRFAHDAECLYIGDTSDRDIFKNEAELQALGFDITLHDKMPDIVLYSRRHERLYFIEAVTSTGAMTPKRIKEIEHMTRESSAERVYITAFPDFKTFKKFVEALAWETEIWLSEVPDHMIHFNGDKFLGIT